MIDDGWLFVKIMNKMLIKNHLAPISISQYRDLFSFPVKTYYEKLGFNFEHQSFEEAGNEFIDEYKEHRYDAELYSETELLLKILTEKGITNSILSAQHQTFLNDLTCHYNIDKYFLNIVGLDNHYAHSKVNNGIELIKKIDIDINKILMVGDTDHDFEVSQALGIDCILISHGHNSILRLKQTNAHIVDNLSKLAYFLEIDFL